MLAKMDLEMELKDLEFRREYLRAQKTISFFDEMINKLEERRVELGFSKSELARRIGRQPSFVRRVLLGKGNPTVRTVFELAYALNLEIVWERIDEKS